MKLTGYRRPDGTVGIRNHILIIPASVCSNEVGAKIATQVNGAISLQNQHGCTELAPDMKQTINTLIGMGKNPNVAAVFVVSLGCEGISAKYVAEEISKTGKMTDYLVIQENGGTLKTIEKGIRIVREMAVYASKFQREEVDIKDIIMATECGGSDTTSGIAANPALGYVTDKHIGMGGTSILSETTEFIGAEHIVAKRAATKEIADKIYEIVRNCEKKAMSMGCDLRGSQPTPGNMQGGLSTIEEKSLGCIYKGGTTEIKGVLEYSERPSGTGLFIMDTPGQDIESITGMTAGGAQIVIFSTGRGTPTGSPIVPVIKVTGNSETYRNMIDNIDINAGTIVDGEATIKDVGEEIFKEMIEVINGKLTKAESLNHHEFGIHRLMSTF